MPVDIVVCAKQVVDPETPASAFRVDPEAQRVAPAQGIPPVVNGFDENAVEAALRIKEAVGANITVISLGTDFVMDVMKKPLSMGADDLVLIEEDDAGGLDASATAYVLCQAIGKLDRFDLILCGRQASDWDNGLVPLGIAETLGLPCITVAQKIEVTDGSLVVERSLADGYEVVEAALPAVVTVTNELGEPRYPTLRGIMTASRKTPTVWAGSDLGLEADKLAPKLLVEELYVPTGETKGELIVGEDEADAGRKLALRLREEKLI